MVTHYHTRVSTSYLHNPPILFSISFYKTQISMGSATKTNTRDTTQVPSAASSASSNTSSAGFNSTSSSKPKLQNKNPLLQTFMQANNPPLVASSNTQVVRNVTISTSKYQRPLLLLVLFFTPLFASCSLELQVYMVYG